MIERQIVASNVKELEIQEYVSKVLKNLGQSHIKLQKTPLGEKIIIHASRPGLIVGRKGQNIKKLTEDLKAKFNLENPQIEINEVMNPDLDAQIVAERVASSLEKFGTQRFKGIGHRVMSDVMNAGALGVEILITGKIPSSRAKRWRFWQGYLKKCGDIAIVGVKKAYTSAQLKTGIVGVQVRIMPPDIKLPDYVKIEDEPSEIIEEMKEEIEQKESKKSKKPTDAKTKKENKEKPKKAKKSSKKKSSNEGTEEEKKEEAKKEKTDANPEQPQAEKENEEASKEEKTEAEPTSEESIDTDNFGEEQEASEETQETPDKTQ